jgi:hypothetical protein
MANKRLITDTCKEKKEVFAIGQEGSIKDLENKLKTCFECSNCIGCKDYIFVTERLLASQKNLVYMIEQIKNEQQIY